MKLEVEAVKTYYTAHFPLTRHPSPNNLDRIQFPIR